MSGYTEKSLSRSEAGRVSILEKPYTSEALLQAVRDDKEISIEDAS